MNEYDDLENILDKKAAEIGEFFDSVRIIATKYNGAITTSTMYSSGTGCLFSQIAATDQWLVEQREYTKEYARQKQRNE